MIKHVLIIISAALAFSTPAFCQDHAAAEALNNLARLCAALTVTP